MRQGNATPLSLTFLFGLLICNLCSVPEAPGQQSNKSRNSATQLYFITNHGCAPCLQVEPGIEALKREGYPVTTVYFDAHRQWATQLGVDRTPTVVMMTNNKIVGRHAGLIDAVTLKKWFAVQGIKSGSVFADAEAGRTKVVLENQPNRNARAARHRQPGINSPKEYSSSTMHKGTRRPGTNSELRALQATVKLKVEDPTGISYATGTIIHSHQGECLVMTCGHVFRDAQGQGEITAEYGFDQPETKTAPGQLIYYDADARDIGLVAIRTSQNITPVPIASLEDTVSRGLPVFSIGCDHGENPTIRRTKIKNKASYDGAIKYDIYGRPVDGRSGGGLFNSAGELIGVCNAAAVEIDEGIYTALDTVYWQIAQVNFQHLFPGNFLTAAVQPVRPANSDNSVATRAESQVAVSSPAALPNVNNREIPITFASSSRRLAPISQRERTPVSWSRHSEVGDLEVCIQIRSKDDPSLTETITISDPTPRLLDYLGSMSAPGSTRRVDNAQLRTGNERKLR